MEVVVECAGKDDQPVLCTEELPLGDFLDTCVEVHGLDKSKTWLLRVDQEVYTPDDQKIVGDVLDLYSSDKLPVEIFMHYKHRAQQELSGKLRKLGVKDEDYLDQAIREQDVETVRLFVQTETYTELLGSKVFDHLDFDCVEQLKVLTEAGVDLDFRGKLDDAPLHRTLTPEIAKVLLDAGADVNARDYADKTPLHLACTLEITEVLLDAGADVNAREYDGGTPLHNARNPEIAKVLLGAGADVNACDDWRETPLHRTRNPAMTKVLVKAGANANVRNWKGDAPLHLARTPEIVKVLLDAGADVHARNGRGETPLHRARYEARSLKTFYGENGSLTRYRLSLEVIDVLVEAGARE